MQESRADAALALLQQRLSLKVRVNGDGIWTEIAAAALVPGDICAVSLGSVISCDFRLLTGNLLLDNPC
jgi:magnesium-transporting ATPase (P-type)